MRKAILRKPHCCETPGIFLNSYKTPHFLAKDEKFLRMHLNLGELLESDSRLVKFLKGERAKQKTTGRRGKKASLDRNAMGRKSVALWLSSPNTYKHMGCHAGKVLTVAAWRSCLRTFSYLREPKRTMPSSGACSNRTLGVLAINGCLNSRTVVYPGSSWLPS